jgi:hypothetical protein
MKIIIKTIITRNMSSKGIIFRIILHSILIVLKKCKTTNKGIGEIHKYLKK